MIEDENFVDAEGAEETPTSLTLGLPDIRTSRQRRWSRLESVDVENFKAIEKAPVPLGDVTILVGPNGSGKSSVLQAIHWAARAASYISPKSGKEMMSFDRIDYIPSSEPLRSAHRGELRPGSASKPTSVVFNHEALQGEGKASVEVRIFAARNGGGITAHIEGGNAVSPYKQRSQFITAYIPGLAGLSERETLLAQPQLRRQAASGDAGGVLRNILLNLASRRPDDTDEDAGAQRLKRLNELISSVHPDVSIVIKFDEREDYTISATYIDPNIPGRARSLETLATGVLQVVQIFAYLVLFRPRILLIDEPDAHLHPDKQERLIEALESAASDFNTQVVLTTHSPHIVRAATSTSTLVWMNRGSVKTDDTDAIRRLLGWGGLDKSAMFFVEDEDDIAIRAIMRQWPELARKVAICRCFGVDNIPRKKLLEGIMVDGQLAMSAIIHRDSDFMDEKEKKKWAKLYEGDGIYPWVTPGCDVESLFCEEEYLSKLYSVDVETARSWRVEAAAKVKRARDTFYEKRKVIQRVVYDNMGGGATAEELWEQKGQTPETVLGKSLWKQLKTVVKAAGHEDKLLDNFFIPEGFEMAPSLKEVILQAVNPPGTD
ncbi:ATP-binding protein [Sinorhizobium fredii]|uniref:ATP-binding protein n=1 Tax=Rhizobium fredii TaxID=380 RepID=UPI001296E079|nr:ATP-binding protein [Sinorhizobium fredii]